MPHSIFFAVIIGLGLACTNSRADIVPAQIKDAIGKKTATYISEGIVQGGDRSVSIATIKEIRTSPKSTKSGFERVVLELFQEQRMPYYQVALNKTKHELTITLWADPVLRFPLNKTLLAMKKLGAIENVDFLPHLEKDLWMTVIALKPGIAVEAFELQSPARVVLDFKK